MSTIPKYILNWKNGGGGGQIPVETSIPENNELLPNVLYILGTITEDIDIDLAEPEDETIVNVYCLTFEIGDTVPVIHWLFDASYIWADGEAPSLEQNTHYEISVMDNLILVASAAIPEVQPETPGE